MIWSSDSSGGGPVIDWAMSCSSFRSWLGTSMGRKSGRAYLSARRLLEFVDLPLQPELLDLRYAHAIMQVVEAVVARLMIKQTLSVGFKFAARIKEQLLVTDAQNRENRAAEEGAQFYDARSAHAFFLIRQISSTIRTNK